MTPFIARKQFLLAQIKQYFAILNDFQCPGSEVNNIQIQPLKNELIQFQQNIGNAENKEVLDIVRKQVNSFLINRWVNTLQQCIIKIECETVAEKQMIRNYRAAVDSAHHFDQVVRQLANALDESLKINSNPDECDSDIENHVTAIIEKVKQLDSNNPTSQQMSATNTTIIPTQEQLPHEMWDYLVMAFLKGYEIPPLAQSSIFFRQLFNENDFYLRLIHRDLTKHPHFMERMCFSRTSVKYLSSFYKVTESPKEYYQRLYRRLLLPLEKNQIDNLLDVAIKINAEIFIAKLLQKMNSAERQQAALSAALAHIEKAATDEDYHTDITRVLLRKITSDQKREVRKLILTPDSEGNTLIHKVAKRNDSFRSGNEAGTDEILKLLFEVLTPEESSQVILTPNQEGATPIHLARVSENVFKVVFGMLLAKDKQQAGQIIVTPNANGCTLIHLEAYYGTTEKLKILFGVLTREQIQQAILTRDPQGLTPYHIAARANSYLSDMLEFLSEMLEPKQKRQIIISTSYEGELSLLNSVIKDYFLFTDYQGSARRQCALAIIRALLTNLTLEDITEHFISPAKSGGFGINIPPNRIIEFLPPSILQKSLGNNDCLAEALLSDPDLRAELYLFDATASLEKNVRAGEYDSQSFNSNCL